MRRATIETELRHHTESLADLGERLESQQEERAGWEARRSEARERREADDQSLSDRMAERILSEGAVASTQAAVEERRQSLEALEGAAGEARSKLEAAREVLHQIALDEERQAGDRRSLEARVTERGWGGVDAATAQLTEEDRSRETDEVERQHSNSGLGQKITFWLILFLALPLGLSILLSMYHFLEHTGRNFCSVRIVTRRIFLRSWSSYIRCCYFG